MAEDSLRIGGLSSGLAVILNSGDGKENPSKPRLVSYSDEFGQQSVERALEYVFGLPNKSIGPLSGPVDSSLVRSIIKNYLYSDSDSLVSNRDGVCISDNGSGPGVIGLEKFSICGEIRIVKPPLLLESLAVFSSARANAYVWKGKWMYEVILETSGIQQLGWATISCPFTDHKGVGDADDSYAFDGRRVRKWNKEAEPYGQPWVAGDVIGCCIDLAHDEISFYRNGVSLGVAFSGIRKMGPGFGYHPAVSLSQGERCELNFGARPFKYPIDGYHPLQAPPSSSSFVKQLLDCLSRLLDMQSVERAEHSSVERLRRLKRFVSLEELFYPVSHGICEEFFSVVEADCQGAEYIGWGPLLLFFMGVFGVRAPHDWLSLDRVLDVFLEFQGSHVMFEHIINALSCACKTASLVLTECPYSGSYSYLALVCHLLRREQLMVLWWKSSDFGFLFEGFLSRKSPNRQDLQCMIPSVWWPGSCEDVSTESSMLLATTALSDAVSKIEEKHRDLCLLVIQFIPALSPPQFPGSVFRTFVQNLLLKYRGADRNMPPPGILSNSVLVSLYTVILHFLSEGFGVGNICGWLKSCDSSGHDIGFLHRGGCQSFPIGLFLKNDPHRAELSRLGGSFSHLSKSHPMHDQEAEVIRWEEGCMDDEETRVTHLTKQKPCCCSWYDMEFTKCSKYPIRTTTKSSRHNCSAIPERSAQVAAECSTGSLNEEISDKPSSSDQSESEFGYRPVQHMRTVPRDSDLASTTLREEELLDALLLLYHIGLAPNFKQASYYMSHQSQSISLLEETDKQIRERACKEQLKRLKETRNNYREEVIDCVRHCAWYRVSLFSRWKQRGMYATCMWVVQLLLVLSKLDSVFIYIPEFYHTFQVEQKRDTIGSEWESLISDTSDLLIFNSPNDSEAFRGVIQKSLDPSVLISQFSQDDINEACQTTVDLDKYKDQTEGAGDMNEMNPVNESFEVASVTNFISGSLTDYMETRMSAPYSFKPDSNLHRGFRRRCLDFEMLAARRKNLDGGSTTNSSTDNKLVPGKPDSDSPRCIVPGIGLHLNALAIASRDNKNMKLETLSSGTQKLSFPSLNSPCTGGAETTYESLPSASTERESDAVENGVQLAEDASQASAYLVNEEFNQNSPKKKRRRLEQAGEGESCKRCNCKKSKCLKLYCECFAAGVYCIEPCSCQDCFNKPIHEDTVLATRKQIESRNPLAFAPKVIRTSDSVPEVGDDLITTPASARHKRGCNCKKSNCLKKYCECFQGGVGCSINCRCEGCKNAFGRKDGSAIMETDGEPGEEETDPSEKNALDKNFEKPDILNNEEQNPASALPTTPLQLCRPLVQLPFSSKSKPPRSFIAIGSSSALYTGQRYGKPSIIRPQNIIEKHFQTIAEDETPEILRGNSSPGTGIKTSSPNSKRISPPQYELGSTPGGRSGRKLILQSIPSFPSLTPKH